MASVTPSVSDLRTIVNDPSTQSAFNLARGENLQLPQGAAIATNTVFYLNNIPIVTSSVFVTQGVTVRTQAGFTVDYTNGLITFSSPPGASGNLPIPFYADYNFNWFVDADYTTFITEGMRLLGFAVAVVGGVITTTIDELLIPACYEMAKVWFYRRRAIQYADKYSASGSGQGQDVKSVTAEFEDKANKAYKAAITMRDDVYKRQGQRNAPSNHTVNFGVTPYIGRR